jgi:hypothetical protein
MKSQSVLHVGYQVPEMKRLALAVVSCLSVLTLFLKDQSLAGIDS